MIKLQLYIEIDRSRKLDHDGSRFGDKVYLDIKISRRRKSRHSDHPVYLNPCVDNRDNNIIILLRLKPEYFCPYMVPCSQ